MATLLLKNVPQALLARLKAQARAHGRSLNTEILVLVKQQLDTPVVDIADELRALRKLLASSQPAPPEPPKMRLRRAPRKRTTSRRPAKP